jgi:hypothetical protein
MTRYHINFKFLKGYRYFISNLFESGTVLKVRIRLFNPSIHFYHGFEPVILLKLKVYMAKSKKLKY